MFSRIACLVCLIAVYARAGDNSAAELARAAKAAEKAGQTVRAYLLYSEAAAEDPKNPSYRANRDALASAAKLLSDSHLESADISADVARAKSAAIAPPAAQTLTEMTAESIEQQKEALLPPPALDIPAGHHDFKLNGDDKSVITRVAAAYGIETLFAPDFDSQPGIRFELDDASFRTAMQAVTDATRTFVFPISAHRLFVARDTLQNRSEFEPQALAVVDLPNAVDPKEIVETANAVRSALGLKGLIGYFADRHEIILRDRVTRERVAKTILQRLLLPKQQLLLHVQLMEVDSTALYHYGIAWQNTFQVIPLGMLSKLRQPILPSVVNAAALLPFGGGLGLFGVGLADANLFAMFTDSSSRVLFDTTMRAGDGEAAHLHFGEKYPIPTSLSTATFSGAGNGVYSPLGQVTQEDLGLELKLTPHVHNSDNIGLDLEAQYETLGAIVLNTVPSINQRQFKGSLIVPEGQWAVIGGIIEEQKSVTKSGFPGLGEIKGLELLFAETTRTNTKTQVLLVIKPTLLTEAPVTDYAGISMGPVNGDRLIF